MNVNFLLFVYFHFPLNIDLQEIEGGNPYLIAIGAATAGVALYNGAVSAGKEIGKGIYYATH
ncbi:hypothetical protein MRS84_22475 [Escherichia coli]|nr:hypothetical protein [Escherichia coli]